MDESDLLKDFNGTPISINDGAKAESIIAVQGDTSNDLYRFFTKTH